MCLLCIDLVPLKHQRGQPLLFLFINKVDMVACVLSEMVLYPVQIGLVEPETLRRGGAGGEEKIKEIRTR